MVPECGFQTTSNKTIFQTFRSAALILTTNFLFNISAKLGPFKFGFLSTFPIVSYQAKAKLSGKIKYLAISINGGVQFSSRWWAEPNHKQRRWLMAPHFTSCRHILHGITALLARRRASEMHKNPRSPNSFQFKNLLLNCNFALQSSNPHHQSSLDTSHGSTRPVISNSIVVWPRVIMCNANSKAQTQFCQPQQQSVAFKPPWSRIT